MDTFKLVSPYKPSGDQPQAIESLVDGINKGMKEQTLLGVTGSGKTNVVLKLIDRVISSGKRVIVLVPEIALTSQTVGRFAARYGDRTEWIAKADAALAPYNK